MTSEPGLLAQANVIPAAASRSNVAAAWYAAALGLALLAVAGFAETRVLHGAAHDTRHATGFPCH